MHAKKRTKFHRHFNTVQSCNLWNSLFPRASLANETRLIRLYGYLQTSISYVMRRISILMAEQMHHKV